MRIHRQAYALVGLMVISQLPGCSGGGGGGGGPSVAVAVTVSPGAMTVPVGGAQYFSAAVQNDASGGGVSWSLSPRSGAGTLTNVTTSSVTYVAPSSPPTGDLAVTITAKSVADHSAWASAVVTVPAVQISVTADIGFIPAGTTSTLTAVVLNDPAQKGVTWSMSPATDAGTLSDTTATSAIYHAPASPPLTDLSVTFVATSVSDPVAVASVTLTVPASVVLMGEFSDLVAAGTTQALTATVLYDPAQTGVTWTISPDSGAGTLSDITSTSVIYNAPAHAPPSDVAVTVTATSNTIESASAQAAITVPASVVSITPGAATVPAGTMQVLTAAVLYDPDQTGVTWTISPDSGAGTLSDITSTSVTYNAPAAAPIADQAVTITATSISNSNVLGSAAITVPTIGVSVGPDTALIPATGVQNFSATVNYDPTHQGVTWSVSQNDTACSPACGTVVALDATTGRYSAPATVPSDPAVTISASSVTDATKSGAASITIGTGVVQLVPASLNFGRIKKTATKVLTVTLTNVGGSPLDIAAFEVTGKNAGKFNQTNDCTASVAAAGSCDISVTFKPGFVGSFNASLDITDSSADSPQLVPLQGTAFNSRVSQAPVAAAAARERMVAAPAPTGPNRVGTRVMDLTDVGRKDTYSAKGVNREVLVRFWYPASVHNDCTRAPYTDPPVWKYFSELLGVKLPAVQTNSCLNAEIRDGAYPVVVFTHGFTGTFTDYTYLFEDLASRGYVVASIDHLFDATAVAFPDGRLVKSVFGSHLGNVVRADEHALDVLESVRERDVQFIVGELSRLNRERGGVFEGRLDTASVAVAGHSLGGLTALNAVAHDDRIRAAVFIDSLLPEGASVAIAKPVLLLDADRTQWGDEERRQWNKLQGPRFAVNLKGAEHVAPTDEVWLAQGAIQTGSMSPEETVAAIRDYVAAFLDHSLLGQPVDPLLSKPSARYAGNEVGGP